MTEVHCKYCKFYIYGGEYGIDSCKKNPIYASTPIMIKRSYRECRVVNENMDCDLFEPSLIARIFYRKYLPLECRSR